MKYKLYQKTENGIILAGEGRTYKDICLLAKCWAKTIGEGDVLLITKVLQDFETGYRVYKAGRAFQQLKRYLLIVYK